jgi:hypothetical protein
MTQMITGVRPARLLLALGAVFWFTGMLHWSEAWDGSGDWTALTIVGLAPLGLALAAGGIAVSSLPRTRWLAVIALVIANIGWLVGGTQEGASLMHLGAALSLAMLAVATHGPCRWLSVAGALAAITIGVALRSETGLWPLDGWFVATFAPMLIGLPFLVFAFDPSAAATIGDRLAARGWAGPATTTRSSANHVAAS